MPQNRWVNFLWTVIVWASFCLLLKIPFFWPLFFFFDLWLELHCHATRSPTVWSGGAFCAELASRRRKPLWRPPIDGRNRSARPGPSPADFTHPLLALVEWKARTPMLHKEHPSQGAPSQREPSHRVHSAAPFFLPASSLPNFWDPMCV